MPTQPGRRKASKRVDPLQPEHWQVTGFQNEVNRSETTGHPADVHAEWSIFWLLGEQNSG